MHTMANHQPLRHDQDRGRGSKTRLNLGHRTTVSRQMPQPRPVLHQLSLLFEQSPLLPVDHITSSIAHMAAELRIPRPGPLARPLRRRLDRNTVTLGELLAANPPVRAVLVHLQSLPPSSLTRPSSRCRAAEFRFFPTARNDSGRQPNTEPTHPTHQTPLLPTLFNTSPTIPTPPPTDPSLPQCSLNYLQHRVLQPRHP